MRYLHTQGVYVGDCGLKVYSIYTTWRSSSCDYEVWYIYILLCEETLQAFCRAHDILCFNLFSLLTALALEGDTYASIFKVTEGTGTYSIHQPISPPPHPRLPRTQRIMWWKQVVCILSPQQLGNRERSTWRSFLRKPSYHDFIDWSLWWVV